MAKIRGVKPETWTDDKFVQLSPLARLLFIGMWNYACDNGHIEDNAVQLKIRLLPMDNCDIATLVDEMVATGQVERHEGFLKIVKLPEHQQINFYWLTLCEWCDHDLHNSFTEADRKVRKSGATGGTQGHNSGAKTDMRGDELKGNDGDTPRAGGGERDAIDSDFAAWYAAYPLKKGKGQAIKAYRTARKKVDADTLLTAMRKQIPTLTAKGLGFCPHPATWLNGERWADEVETSETSDEPSRPTALRQCDTRAPHDRHRWEDAHNRYFCQGET